MLQETVLPDDAADAMTCDLVRSVTASGRRARLPVRGWSMRPWLRDGDLVEIAPARAADLRRGDVAAFTSPAGGLVVHRFLARTHHALLFRGDACPAPDPPVAPRQILGRVTAVVRHGRRRVIGAGWRRAAGPAVPAAASAVRAALRLHGALLEVWRGGPPLPAGGGEDARNDRRVLAWLLGTERRHDRIAHAQNLLERAPWRELAPLAAWQARCGACARPDPARRKTWESAEDQALVHSAQAEDLLRHLAALLAEHQAELLLVKGAALGFGGVYPAPHLRLAADVDTCCRPADRQRILAILLNDGFRNAEPEYPLSYYLRFRGEAALFHPGHAWPRLEIHWAGAGRLGYARRLTAQRLWAESAPGPFGPALRTLSPEMEIVQSVVHLTKHLRALRPSWLLDLALLGNPALLGRSDGPLPRSADWPRAGRLLAEMRLEWPAWFALNALEARLPGTLPSGLMETLARTRRRGPAAWPEMQALHADGWRVRLLEAIHLPLRDGFAYLAEHIAPRRSVMERLYPRASGRPLAPFHLLRWGRILRTALRGKTQHD